MLCDGSAVHQEVPEAPQRAPRRPPRSRPVAPVSPPRLYSQIPDGVTAKNKPTPEQVPPQDSREAVSAYGPIFSFPFSPLANVQSRPVF